MIRTLFAIASFTSGRSTSGRTYKFANETVVVKHSIRSFGNWLNSEVRIHEGKDEALQILNEIVKHTEALWVIAF